MRIGIILMTLLVLPTSIANAATYHVDARAGGPGKGTAADPFPTIQQAASVMQAGDTCLIHAGVYRETIVPAQSGTATRPMTFRPVTGERVIISGSDVVRGWQQEPDGLHAAEVALSLGHENQVFCDGQMMWEARWPDAGGRSAKHLLQFKQARMAKGTTPTKIVDPDLPDRDWTGASVWVSSHKRWFSWTGKVTGHGKGFLQVVNNADPAGNHVCREKGVYYVFGAKAALDEENEWYYDAAAKRLYVRVPGGGDPGDRVSIKRRHHAFDLSGKAHIAVEGLEIHGASIATDQRSRHLRFDGLRMRYVYHSNRAEQQYRSQEVSGFILAGEGHELRNSEIAYSSGNGVLLPGRNLATGHLTLGSNHRIINNYLHDCNYIGGLAAPLMFAEWTAGHVVSHNTITRSGRAAVSTPGLYDCLFQHNDVGHAGYLTWDLGLTYGNGGEGGGSEIRFNHFHDNHSGHLAFGIYFDHGWRNVLIHHNLVWNVKHRGMLNNIDAHFMQWYHNTSVGCQTSYSGNWGPKTRRNLLGCVLMNNLSTAKPGGIHGTGIHIQSNAWQARGLVDGRYLDVGHPSIDKAVHVPGINDAFQGKAPDPGAFESGAAPWQAGHDFENPPAEIDEERSRPPHRNLLTNPALHRGSSRGWDLAGPAIEVIFERHNQWQLKERVVMRGHSFELGTGQNAVRQAVTELEPGATYRLTGMFRVAKGERARLAVEIEGSARQESEALTATVAHPKDWWKPIILTFTVPAGATRATICAEKISTGTGKVYVDDMGLQKVP